MNQNNSFLSHVSQDIPHHVSQQSFLHHVSQVIPVMCHKVFLTMCHNCHSSIMCHKSFLSHVSQVISYHVSQLSFLHHVSQVIPLSCVTSHSLTTCHKSFFNVCHKLFLSTTTKSFLSWSQLMWQGNSYLNTPHYQLFLTHVSLQVTPWPHHSSAIVTTDHCPPMCCLKSFPRGASLQVQLCVTSSQSSACVTVSCSLATCQFKPFPIHFQNCQ